MRQLSRWEMPSALNGLVASSSPLEDLKQLDHTIVPSLTTIVHHCPTTFSIHRAWLGTKKPPEVSTFPWLSTLESSHHRNWWKRRRKRLRVVRLHGAVHRVLNHAIQRLHFSEPFQEARAL